MLPRVAAARKLVPVSVTNLRCASSQPVLWKREILEIKEHPERDVVNFPRYKCPEHPAPVRLGFIPEEWFQFFYPKTGLTGPYMFGGALITTVLSKEMMVVEHEFVFGVVLFSSIALVHKLYGKDVAALLDTEVDKELEEQNSGVDESRQFLTEQIQAQELAQRQTDCQAMVFDVKRENVALQLEAEFRKRQLKVYEEVKKRLDYHLETINIERRLQQKHMVDWIVSNVEKSISAQQEKDALRKCISDLKSLAVKA